MSLHPKKATCSCHPDTMRQRFVAAIDAETTAIFLAMILGVMIGGCSAIGIPKVKLVRSNLSAPPKTLEQEAFDSYCDYNMQIRAGGEVFPPNCAERAAKWVLPTLGGTAVEP